MKKTPIPQVLLFLGLWLLYTLYLVFSGTKLPGSDVFIFKEAGVNLALKGKFVVSNLPFMPSNEEFTYYFYPPLYPFLYGLWTKVVGFGYEQGVLFDSFVKLIRTILILSFVWSPFKNASKTKISIFLSFLLILSFLTSDGDRPDDLASILGFLSWHYLFRNGMLNKVACGVLLGITAGTSATAGVFFTLGVLAYLWPWLKNLASLLIVGGLSLVVFLTIAAPIFIREPELYALFNRQASFSNFLHFRNFEGWSKIGSFLAFWAERLYICLMGAPSVTFAAIVLALASLWVAQTEKLPSPWRTFIGAGLGMFPLIAIVWIMQPYYQWFSILAFIAFIGYHALTLKKKSAALLTVLGIALLPKAYEETKQFYISLQTPSTETVHEVGRLLRAEIPVGSSVAVTHDQFYTLNRDYKISNVGHICMHAEDADYIYMSRAEGKAKQEIPIPNPCSTRAACFELVKNTSENKKFSLFGSATEYYVKTSGGTLYKNTRCRGVKIPWNVSAEEFLKKN